MHTTTIRRVSVLLLASLLTATTGACGDEEPADGSDTETTVQTTESPAETAPETSEALEIGLVECAQVGFPTGIDPAVAEQRLLDDQSLYLDDSGEARFTLIAKDCSDITVDGESVGPGRFNTAWVRIEGPDEVRSFSESPQVEVNPTDYFHPVLFQTDNAAFAEAAAAFGVPMTLADSMAMDPPGAESRSGSVTDSEVEPPLEYDWTYSGGNPLPTDPPSGVVHVLEGPDRNGEGILDYDIECPVTGGRFAGETNIQFESGSPLEDLVGTGYSGTGPAPELSCAVRITPRGD